MVPLFTQGLPGFRVSFVFQFPGDAEKHPLGGGEVHHLLQRVPQVQEVGDEGQVLIARDQFFTSSLTAPPSPYIARMAETTVLMSPAFSRKTAGTMSVGAPLMP